MSVNSTTTRKGRVARILLHNFVIQSNEVTIKSLLTILIVLIDIIRSKSAIRNENYFNILIILHLKDVVLKRCNIAFHSGGMHPGHYTFCLYKSDTWFQLDSQQMKKVLTQNSYLRLLSRLLGNKVPKILDQVPPFLVPAYWCLS